MARKITDLRNETVSDHDAPPKADEVLGRIAVAWLGSRDVHRADQRIPRNPQELAQWWIRMQPPPIEPFDRPQQQTKWDGTGTFWKTPYIDRIRNTLIKFLSLGHEFQGLIIAAAEDGIFWRGDSKAFFIAVISETEKMHAMGIEAYRGKAEKQTEEFIESTVIR
jgi:hypothetical protein